MTSSDIASKIKNSMEYLFSNKNIYKDFYDHVFIPYDRNEIDLKEIGNELLELIPNSEIPDVYLNRILIDDNGIEYIYWRYKGRVFNMSYKDKQKDYSAYIEIACVL